MILEYVGGPWDGRREQVRDREPQPWRVLAYKEGLNPRSVIYVLWRCDVDGRYLYRYEPKMVKA